MKRFEKCLKALLDSYNSDCVPPYCPNFPEITEAEFRFLAAKGLIVLTADGDDTFYAVPTNSGLTYFYQKAEDSRRFWREHLVNFVGGFVSGVLTTILATVIIREWL